MREFAYFIIAFIVLAVTWMFAALIYYIVVPYVEDKLISVFGPVKSQYQQSLDTLTLSVERIINGIPYLLLLVLVFGSIAYAYRVATHREPYYTW